MALRLNGPLLRRLGHQLQRRAISTSKKNSDTATIAAETCEKTKAPVAHKNWISYGFEHKSKADDRRATHSLFFSSVTLVLVVGGYYYMYLPDFGGFEWAQREAYLELRRREEAGLPLIDPNLISSSKIALPSEEELGDFEIVI